MKTLLPAYRQVLSWYEQWLKPDYSLSYVPHWFFVDWAAGFDYGEPIREKEGNSALQDLMYIMTLEFAAEMEQAIGLPAMRIITGRSLPRCVRRSARNIGTLPVIYSPIRRIIVAIPSM